jgi:hypothetical protein
MQIAPNNPMNGPRSFHVISSSMPTSMRDKKTQKRRKSQEEADKVKQKQA